MSTVYFLGFISGIVFIILAIAMYKNYEKKKKIQQAWEKRFEKCVLEYNGYVYYKGFTYEEVEELKKAREISFDEFSLKLCLMGIEHESKSKGL